MDNYTNDFKNYTLGVTIDSMWMKLIPDFSDELVKCLKTDYPAVVIYEDKRHKHLVEDALDVTSSAKELFCDSTHRYCEYSEIKDSGRYYMSFVIADGLDAYVALSCGLYEGKIGKSNRTLYALRRMAYRLLNAARLTNTHYDILWRYAAKAAEELGFETKSANNMRFELADFDREQTILRKITNDKLKAYDIPVSTESEYLKNFDYKPWIVGIVADDILNGKITATFRGQTVPEEKLYNKSMHNVLLLMLGSFGMTPEVILDEMYAIGLIKNEDVKTIDTEVNKLNRVFDMAAVKRLDILALEYIVPDDFNINWR